MDFSCCWTYHPTWSKQRPINRSICLANFLAQLSSGYQLSFSLHFCWPSLTAHLPSDLSSQRRHRYCTGCIPLLYRFILVSTGWYWLYTGLYWIYKGLYRFYIGLYWIITGIPVRLVYTDSYWFHTEFIPIWFILDLYRFILDVYHLYWKYTHLL